MMHKGGLGTGSQSPSFNSEGKRKDLKLSGFETIIVSHPPSLPGKKVGTKIKAWWLPAKHLKVKTYPSMEPSHPFKPQFSDGPP